MIGPKFERWRMKGLMATRRTELQPPRPEEVMKAIENPSRLARRLQTIFIKEKGIVTVPKIHRTYAGRWQRAEGAWSWFMFTREGTVIGSQWSATKVARAKCREYSKEWRGGDIHVTPEE